MFYSRERQTRRSQNKTFYIILHHTRPRTRNKLFKLTRNPTLAGYFSSKRSIECRSRRHSKIYAASQLKKKKKINLFCRCYFLHLNQYILSRRQSRLETFRVSDYPNENISFSKLYLLAGASVIKIVRKLLEYGIPSDLSFERDSTQLPPTFNRG